MPLYLDASLDARLDSVESVQEIAPAPSGDATGATDTAALQAWLTTVTSEKLVGLLRPAGSLAPYFINDWLTIPPSSGWDVEGQGRWATTIKQVTNNKGHFKLSGQGSANFRFANFGLDWSSAQTGNTNAAGFAFEETGAQNGYGWYEWLIENIVFNNGYLGVGQIGTLTNVPVWGCTMRRLLFERQWRGPLIKLDSGSSGQPAITIEKIYAFGDNIGAVDPITVKDGRTAALRMVEFNNFARPRLILLDNCANSQLESIRDEAGTISTGGEGLITVSGGNAEIRGFEMLSKTIALGGGNYTYGIRAISGAKVKASGVHTQDFTNTSGALYLVQGGDAGRCHLEQYGLAAGVGSVYPFDNSPLRWNIERLGLTQVIATDAAVALTPAESPEQIFHTGTLTADRAVTLATTGALDGERFRITRTGGGAFNLNVGTGPLKALTTNTWAEFRYDYNNGAWKLAAYGALAAEEWHEIGAGGEPAFANSWVNHSPGSNATAAFYKDPFGCVHLKGLIKDGTLPAVAFTLPVGYRPALDTYFPAVSNGLFGSVLVLANGGVQPQVGDNAWVALSINSFRAA